MRVTHNFCNIRQGSLKNWSHQLESSSKRYFTEGPLLTDGRNISKWLKFWSEGFVKYFQMDGNFIDTRDYRSHFLHQIVATHKTFKIKSRVFACSIPWLCIVKNGQKWPKMTIP